MDMSRGKQIVINIEEELDADSVKTFRKILVDRDLLLPSQDNYGTMLRFLKATRSFEETEYNYDRATLMWEEMIEWRRENGVDTIIQDFKYEEYEDVQLCYPEGFHGVDKEGRPIYIKYYDKSDYIRLMKVTTMDRFMKSYIRECEKMVVEKFPACSEIANKPIESVVRIFVLPVGLLNHKEWGFRSSWIASKISYGIGQVRSNYYPKIDHQMFIINAGKVAKVMFRLLSRFDDPRDRPGGVYVLGQNFQNKLLEFIDEDQLPTLLGGSCSCAGKGGCLRFEKGPWEVPKTIKAKNAEKDSNKTKETPESMHNVKALPDVDSSSPETVQERSFSKSPFLSTSKEKDGYEMILYKENGLLETKHIHELLPDLEATTLHEMTCQKCTELDSKVNLLSDKLDRLQTTLDQLLLAQELPNN